MDRTKSLIIGFVVAFIIGGGGGFALVPLAASGKSDNSSAAPAAVSPAPRVLVEDVTGTAKILARGDVWRKARAGDAIDRPTILITEGAGSSITVSHNGVRIIVRHDARVGLSAQGAPLSLQLDHGLVLVYSPGIQTRVFVPESQAVLTGEAFGAWLRRDHLITAVLESEVALETPSISSKYGKGREIVLTPRGPIPVALPSQLELQVDRTDKAGARFVLNGRTAPNAELIARRAGRLDRVDVSTKGAFTVELDSSSPAKGDLVAYDAAGRSAEHGAPSGTLDDVLAAIARGGAAATGGRAAEAAPPSEPPARAAEPAKTIEPAEPPPAAAEEPARAEPAEVAPARAAKEPARPAPRPAAKKKAPPAEVVEGQPRGAEAAPVELEMPALPKDPAPVEEAAPAKKAPKKKGKAADGEAPAAQPEKKGDAVELQWE